MNSLFQHMVQASEEDEKYILVKLLSMYKCDNKNIEWSSNIPDLRNTDLGITVPTVMLSTIEKQTGAEDEQSRYMQESIKMVGSSGGLNE